MTRQVQDLEKQLQAAKNTIISLRAQTGELKISSAVPDNLKIPDISANPQRRPHPPPPHNITDVRSTIRNYSKGVFKPPPPYRQVGKQSDFPHPIPELPKRAISDHILSQYYSTFHAVAPILHWPTFIKDVERVYEKGTLSEEPPTWSSVLFGVYACGMISVTDKAVRAIYPDSGRQFIECSRMMTDLFNDEFQLDHCRSALLISIFMTELNCKSAGWTWLGSTIRIAQDIGLHRESGPWGIVDNEMRRRVWWGVYVWDR